jgi:hypothetical protein
MRCAGAAMRQLPQTEIFPAFVSKVQTYPLRAAPYELVCSGVSARATCQIDSKQYRGLIRRLKSSPISASEIESADCTADGKRYWSDVLERPEVIKAITR